MERKCGDMVGHNFPLEKRRRSCEASTLKKTLLHIAHPDVHWLGVESEVVSLPNSSPSTRDTYRSQSMPRGTAHHEEIEAFGDVCCRRAQPVQLELTR